MSTQNEIKERTKSYKRSLLLLSVLLAIVFSWFLSSLLLPILVGGVLAYTFMPVVTFFSHKGIPRLLSVLLLVVLMFTGVLSLIYIAQNQMPDRNQQLQLRVIALHQLNERYQELMKSGSEHESSSLLYDIAGDETDPAMDYINTLIALNSDELTSLRSHLQSNEKYSKARINQLLTYIDSNTQLKLYVTGEKVTDVVSDQGFRILSRQQRSEAVEAEDSFIIRAFNVLSIWLIVPIIFFFLLNDRGSMIKSIVSMVPNIYFEMTLTSIRNADNAIGHYLRGTLLEAIAVFACFLIVLLLIGFSITASVIIAFICAIFNIVPIFGAIGGIILCVVYTLVTEDVNSIIGFIDETNIIMFAAIAALLVQTIDNTILKPYILGNATDLHPVAVILIVLAGGVLFGFWGILFSVPVAVIIKVLATTVHQRLKMYHLIKV